MKNINFMYILPSNYFASMSDSMVDYCNSRDLQ